MTDRAGKKVSDVVRPLPRADEEDHRLRVAVEAVLGQRFVPGNRITVLRNGDEIFPSMLEAIEGAEESIEFVTFVYWTGDIARRFAHALADKARAGVHVRVLLDGFGSLPMDQELIEELQAAGAQVEKFRPIARWKVWESDHRTHRKILIVDNEIGFTGGVGIAEEWEGDARNPSEWRDTHFRVEGPAVLGLRAAFLTDWRDTGHAISERDVAVTRPEDRGDSQVAVVDGSAQIGHNDAQRMLEALVAAARERIIIQTPYFNPTQSLLEALVDAKHRGVDIDIVLPGPHIDKRISRVVAKERYDLLLDHGIRVWEYQTSMMHVKTVLVDHQAACIGSVNINRRSVEKDEEVALIVFDEEITAELEAHFEDDIESSTQVIGDDMRPKPWERAVTWALRPVRREF